MWDRLSIFCALMCVALGAPLSTTAPCPESCSCETLKSGQLQIQCATQKFLEKLQPKQINDIVSLDLSNSNITKLHSKLKKLRNLNTVNLSSNNIYDITELSFLPKLNNLNLRSNHIKYFTLPKHLHFLDVSRNYLTYIPHELKSLSDLKEVNLSENPISCSCDIIKERDLLLNAGINLVKPVSCHSPEKFRGHSLQSVSCDDFADGMQGDEPVDGSGDEPPKIEDADVFDDNHTNIPGIEDEELIPQSPQPTNAASEEEEEEGSGDEDIFDVPHEAPEVEDEYGEEGSGESTFAPILTIKACHFNCSQLTIDEPKNETGLKDPDILNEIINIGNNPEEISTEAPVVEIVNKVEISRSSVAKKSEDIVEASKEPQQSSWSTNLIIVIALIALMICLVGYSVLKKRKARRRRREPQVNGEEMRPLNANVIPEKAPLMNGQNGNMNGKPSEEPVELRKTELDSKIPPDDYVDIRKSKEEDSLLPEAHRVTIQEKQLSSPKTPLLVNRLRNEDGNIITTPDSDYELKYNSS